MDILRNLEGTLSQQYSQLGIMSQFILAANLTILIFVLFNIIRQLLAKNTNEPPVVFHWLPFLGSTIIYGMNPPQFLKENRAKYGDIFTFILLGRKTTVYLGPQGNNFILNGKQREISAEEIYSVLTTPVFGKDIIYDCPNSKLMEQKKFMKVALTSETLRSYVQIISDEVQTYFQRSPAFKGKSGVTNIPSVMAEITILTASHTLQGRDIRARFDETFAPLYHDLDMGFSPLNFTLHWAPLPWNRRRDNAQQRLAKIYMDTIQERRSRNDVQGHDILTHLMSSTYKSGVAVPDHEIANMMIALLMAGQHTSSSSSSWIMLWLAARPDVMEELYQEQREILGTDMLPLAYEVLDNLVLHQAVVKETLRLHSSIHSIMRAVKQPLHVPGTKYVIPTDHVLLAAPIVSATDPQYFPDPDVWDPHRWLEGSPRAPTFVHSEADWEEKVEYAVGRGAGSPFLPFGAGRHRCIGEKFAYVQLQTIVANVVRLFEFRNVDGSTNKVAGTDYASLFSKPLEPAHIHWERRQLA
ncbi:eburicol 14a-demethylase [Hypoxylon sp. NC1633]|nr:eburicol 14a-demethylase [Hypoxylon sp. NC1633]